MRIRENGPVLNIQSVPLAFRPVFLCMYVFFGGLALIFFFSFRGQPHAEPWLTWYGVSIPAFIGLCFFVSGLFIHQKKDIRIDKGSGLLTINGRKRASLADVKAVQVSRNRTGPDSSSYLIGLLLPDDNAVLGVFARGEANRITGRVSRFLGEPVVQQPDQLQSDIKLVMPPGPPVAEPTLGFGSRSRQAFGSLWLAGLCFIFGSAFLTVRVTSSAPDDGSKSSPLVSALVHGAALATGIALWGGAFFFGRRAAMALLYPPVLLDRSRDVIRLRGSNIGRLSDVRAVGLSRNDLDDLTTYSISVLTGVNEEHLLYKSTDSNLIEQGALRMAAFLQRPVWKF